MFHPHDQEQDFATCIEIGKTSEQKYHTDRAIIWKHEPASNTRCCSGSFHYTSAAIVDDAIHCRNTCFDKHAYPFACLGIFRFNIRQSKVDGFAKEAVRRDREVGARQHLAKKESAPKSSTAPQAAKASTLAKKPSRRKLTKAQLPTSASKRPLQAPPELAHLNVDPPKQKPDSQKPLPPPRPSRDGTLNLADLSRPSPVVQSDLPRLYTTYHKRTPSQETPDPTSSPRSKSRLGFSSRTTSRTGSRNESPRIDSAISPPPSARRFHRGPTPDTATQEGVAPSRKDSPAVGPGPSPSKSPRFGIFSRKPKAEAKVVEKPVRRPSKGPAAGTGHEGYGRFSSRGRNGSTSSSAGFRSPSADSTTSSAPRPSNASSRRKGSRGSKDAAELDEFLRERLEPRVLRGSGSTFNTGSSSDFAGTSLYPASSKASSLDSYPHPQLLPSAMQSKDSVSSSRRPVLARNNTSESSDTDFEVQQPTIAARRSLTRLSQTDSKSPVRVPAPINTSLAPSTTTYIDSNDTETVWPQTDSSMPPFEDPFHGKEGLWLRSPTQEPIAKQGRKWNFFQRSKGKAKAMDPPTMIEMPPRSPQRAVAHYAMPDSQDPLNLDEVRRLVLDNETSQDESASDSNRLSKIVPYEGRHLSLLPSPPSPGFSSDSYFKARPLLPRISVQRQDSPDTPEVLDAPPYQAAHAVNIAQSPGQGHLNSLAVPSDPSSVLRPAIGTPEPDSTSNTTPDLGNESPRQPRLSPIGRIPAVVSRRDRDRKLSDNSFSRPFARHQPRPTVKPPGSVYSQIREMASPIEVGSQPVSSTSTRSDFNSTEIKSSVNTNQASTSTNRTSMDIHNHTEFFVFPPRKNSEQSYQSGSTSSGYPSWTNALYPPPQQYEDVWDEYDDFMDEHVPLKKAKAKRSLGAPFQYPDTVHGGSIRSLVPPPAGQPPTSELPIPPGSEVASTILSVPQQISRFLQPSLTPMTPDTISALIGSYGGRSTSTLFISNRDSSLTEARLSTQQPLRSSFGSVQGSVMSLRHSKGSRHSRSASLPEARHSQASTAILIRQEQDAQLPDIVEVPGELSPSARLRQSALMTSKWLSFGRVLFSPAHNELQFVNEPRVLVLDGLSSDWSFYVALNYPEATVYNMGASLSACPSLSWPASDGPPPPNHRQIPLTSIAASFPFPKGFFTAVVLRYPIATTETSYAACISECKRVLRPGGHLEVTVLDLDLMNMGSKTRKAVRGLKTRMQQHDREVCLQNLSDVLVRLIGRRGFESVQRCVVGVPTAGRIPRSQDLSSSGSASSAISKRPINPPRGASDNDFSFSNLLVGNYGSQYEPGKNNDESITKMVAKVGRWWYSTCYEKALLSTDRSIWNESGLVRECEKQGTSFRLLICHAQKPLQTRRRTAGPNWNGTEQWRE
ncbi:uncharacterized protein MYCFIDRAFT_213694 [Pseudocercospora fijiensis CIRAD86]|uniref:Methyltransferase type 11 domain-containing protein n=1 Tax=Pseudocercospora fijiensis (strain CIRAD86) TaxID=383855 RepID=N1Q9E4_PSEFD|nr:uncharacterized protein MYCFIDRAFT_213694 [Pseudocercospora fijiensis CIRAD86]EME89494.1 hypothetical protein MYCFIDRAFT_213694 [Pseudocercospora fijiensis CIRAD86]